MVLKGKMVLFLGSSVTYGCGEKGYSFADVMESACGINKIKVAVSGTTLADRDETSYVSRLKKVDKQTKVDLFICQLSTNDAALNVPLSEVESALRFIAEYAKETFRCSVMFYTGTYFENENYRKMVSLLLSLQKEYGFYVLDLFNDGEMTAVSGELYKKYMSDPVHPTKLGYEDWWTPKFIDFCEKI